MLQDKLRCVQWQKHTCTEKNLHVRTNLWSLQVSTNWRAAVKCLLGTFHHLSQLGTTRDASKPVDLSVASSSSFYFWFPLPFLPACDMFIFFWNLNACLKHTCVNFLTLNTSSHAPFPPYFTPNAPHLYLFHSPNLSLFQNSRAHQTQLGSPSLSSSPSSWPQLHSTSNATHGAETEWGM